MKNKVPEATVGAIMKLSTFCACPGGSSPSSKRIFDAIAAGCIPIIMSEDFAWPFSTEFESKYDVHPKSFSLRWKAKYLSGIEYDKECNLTGSSTQSISDMLEKIPSSEIKQLRRNLKDVTKLYSYWRDTGRDGPVNLLAKNVLPDGGASHALVEALADRMDGSRWEMCRKELSRPMFRGVDSNEFIC